MLTGTVTTNGLQTNYGFEIGTEPSHYGPATGLGSIGGATTEEVSVRLGELQPECPEAQQSAEGLQEEKGRRANQV